MNPNLTRQELRIANMVCKGMSNKEIANILGVGIKTIKAHLTHVYSKQGVKNRLELIVKRGKDEYTRSGDEG